MTNGLEKAKKLTKAEIVFLRRIKLWDDEVARIGNAAVSGPYRGYGQAFGKWKPIAERLNTRGLCNISGYADWFIENAWCVFPTPLGLTALQSIDTGGSEG